MTIPGHDIRAARVGFVENDMQIHGKFLINELEQLLSQLGTNIPDALAQRISTRMGTAMQENIDEGGYPTPWVMSWREQLGGGDTLKDTGELYNGLPSEPYSVEGHELHKRIETRKNKDGYSLAATLVNGGWVYPKGVHYTSFMPQGFGLAFPKSEVKGKIYMPPGVGVYIPARDFTIMSEGAQADILNIIEDYIEEEKKKMGFDIIDSSHTAG